MADGNHHDDEDDDNGDPHEHMTNDFHGAGMTFGAVSNTAIDYRLTWLGPVVDTPSIPPLVGMRHRLPGRPPGDGVG